MLTFTCKPSSFSARANAEGKILVPDGNGSYRLETPPPVPPRPAHYSKLSLIRALKSAGLWMEVKSAIIAADVLDESFVPCAIPSPPVIRMWI